jgi:ABC-type antimicrobial peptide transport system permease subunit
VKASRLKDAALIALVDIRKNTVRSFLSVSGIVIGIAAVTGILCMGASARDMVFAQFSALGPRGYRVIPGYDRPTRRIGELTFAQAERLEKVEGIASVFGEAEIKNLTVRTRKMRDTATMRAVSAARFKKDAPELIAGRLFTAEEESGRSRFCLVNEPLARSLFGERSALNKEIWIEAAPWKIVGVYQPKKTPFTGGGKVVPEALTPLKSALRTTQGLKLSAFGVRLKPGTKGDASKRILASLTRGNKTREGLFRVLSPKAFLKKRTEAIKTLTSIAAVIASISLFVGGMGVMNMMLTSVAERTREIGLRRALGARKTDILYQFLIESSVLNGFGGVLGAVLGASLTLLIPELLPASMQGEGGFVAKVYPGFMVLGVFCAALLGVVFGAYPAAKAAAMAPADALRVE